MDVNVVVCLNTGRADTTAPAHLLVNLRANIISSPDARRQEHCDTTWGKCVFALSGNGFHIAGIYSQPESRGNRLLIFSLAAQIGSMKDRTLRRDFPRRGTWRIFESGKKSAKTGFISCNKSKTRCAR